MGCVLSDENSNEIQEAIMVKDSYSMEPIE